MLLPSSATLLPLSKVTKRQLLEELQSKLLVEDCDCLHNPVFSFTNMRNSLGEGEGYAIDWGGQASIITNDLICRHVYWCPATTGWGCNQDFINAASDRFSDY